VIAIVAINSFDMFNANELEEIIIGFKCENWNVFITLWEMSRLFQTLTNVILAEFDELMLLVAPTIACHACYISGHHIQFLNQFFGFRVILSLRFGY
jgi:hypothetical protein